MNHRRRLIECWWLILLVPFGILAWVAFGYIGLRAQKRRWLAYGSVEDLGALFELPAPDVEELRERTIFVRV